MAKRCMGCMKMKNNSPICEHCGYDENIPNPSNTLPIGTVLRGRYQVGRMLDLNDFSITYIGWDNYANSPIAIKEFYPNILASRDCSNSLSVSYHDASCQEYKNRFQLEARDLWQPNWSSGGIGIHLDSIFEENNTAYLIMEYVEGLSPREYLHLRKKPFHLTEILPILLPVIKTLEQFHKGHLVYERFSPDSILIQKDGTVKLLDFVTNSFHRSWKEYNRLDDRYIFINSFFSIETYNRRYGDPGPWSVVYSVCAILYYCLTGKVPMNCVERLEEDTVDWKQIPGLSQQQIAALERGMAVDPKDRISSLEELELALYADFQYNPHRDFITENLTPNKEHKGNPTKKKEEPIMPKRCFGCMKLKNNSPICEHCGYNENIPNVSNALPIGTVLKDQYVVGKVLDKAPDGIHYLDRFSISYIGFDKNLDAPVTILEYYPDYLARRDCSASLSVSYIYETAFRHQKQFFQEARKLAKLHTIPGVTHIHNIFQENNTTYIILEHFAGITLEDYMRIQKRALTLSEVFHVMIPIIKTAEQMHSNGILHRNIVPSRILIQPNGVPKLLDFVEESVITSYIVGTRFETIDDAPVPSYDFMPPEQYKLDEPSGTWSDVYLICATIYYCLTGKIPQYSRSRIREVDTVDWKQIPGLNRHQIAALEKGMAVDYKKRTDSLEELELELFRFD